jgi:adenylate cyclase
MAVEIERKFLVKDDSWRQSAGPGIHYRQAYMTQAGDRGSVRVRIGNGKAWLNIKSATLDVTRLEYEYPVPLHEANEMVDHLCGRSVDKTRYEVKQGKHTWEIDVFEGDNAGLVVAEIELQSEDEVFGKPAWLGEEVSHDPRYYNVCLVEKPYKDW